jgi:hypothetical protein
MYFQNLPYTFYTLDDYASAQLVTNIFIRAVISDSAKTNYALYDDYDILDGETPEILADKLYGSSLYHWIILMMNDIVDARYEWPLSYTNLLAYCNGKYTNINGIHHYEDSDGNTVLSTESGAVAVSNFEYEEIVNEAKRRIKVLRPEYVSSIVKDFKNKMAAINE